jgi:hypothetical protein
MYADRIGFFDPFARGGLMIKVDQCGLLTSGVAKIGSQIR